MKKFLGGIKKNIFYISLITGMAVLVTVLGLYNAQTNSKEKTITIGQNTPNDSTTEADAKEALNDKKNDKNSGVSDEGTSEQKDIETDNTIEDSAASTAVRVLRLELQEFQMTACITIQRIAYHGL